MIHRNVEFQMKQGPGHGLDTNRQRDDGDSTIDNLLYDESHPTPVAYSHQTRRH